MSISSELSYLFLILIINTIFSVLIIWKTRTKRSNRTKFLGPSIIVLSMVFSIGLIILIAILPQSPLFIVMWIVYDLIISFVCCMEIPVYLMLSKYDSKLVSLLKNLRSDLIKMRFSFDSSLENLIKKKNENTLFLEETNLNSLLVDFIESCNKLNNLDENLWKVTLSEISSVISEIANRSKHPFPKLIDILALSGLSIILAQFLKMLS